MTETEGLLCMMTGLLAAKQKGAVKKKGRDATRRNR